jgi:hypothetical protein
MKRCIVGGFAALLMAAGMIVSAPSAGAGCWYGGPVISKCDGPVQPDGTWQRCVATPQVVPRGASSYLIPVKNCGLMGAGQAPTDFLFADPPTHIDD